MQAVPVPHAVHQTTHRHLWPGALPLDRAHGSAALLRGHGYDRRMAVGSDSCCIAPSRLMRVVRTVSGP